MAKRIGAYFSKKISYVRALSWIVGSSIIISFIGHKVFEKSIRFKKKKAPEMVAYVVQTGPQKEALLSDYLMEKLSLSIDKPVLFTSFDVMEAKKTLQQSPVIAEVDVKKVVPNIIYVDYSVRKPFVWVVDYHNAALDKEGIVIPAYPFFSPKKMPKIYFGKENPQPQSYGEKMTGRSWDLAVSVLDCLQEEGKDLFFIKQIDVSEAFASSLGRREIVVALENEIYIQDTPCISTHFLRLTPKAYKEEIVKYFSLREYLLEAESQEIIPSGTRRVKDKTIDLRISQLAYIAPAD
jgi:hypothetical protein